MPARPSPGKPMPVASRTDFVIIGLTAGVSFHRNPCIAAEIDWSRRHGVVAAPYTIVTLPNSGQVSAYGQHGPYRGALFKVRNAARAEVLADLQTMHDVGLPGRIVWIDVERIVHYQPWSASRAKNVAAIRAIIATLEHAGVRVGVYTDRNDWAAITGGLRLPGLPTWVTAGPSTESAAASLCGERGPSGGPAYIGQWWNRKYDYDLTCPAMRVRQRYFTRLR